MRRLLFLLVAVLWSSAPSAQRAASRDIARDVARIDAIAVDASGRFIRDLKLDDLQIVEGDVVHPITELRLIRAAGVTADAAVFRPIASQLDEKAEAASEETRLAAIFLDDYHVTPGPAVARVREVIDRLVETTFAPRDLVATVRPLDSLPNIRLTRDRSQLVRALAAFDGRKGDYVARTALERALVAADPARADGARSQVAVSAVNALALHLGSLRPGRKTLIVVSEGFAAPPQTRGEAGLPSIASIVRSANRSGVSIYVIDPRALVGDADSRRPTTDARQVQTLRTLADETDGLAILTPSDVSTGLTRLARDTAEYYMIGFQPQTSQRGRQESVELRSRRADVLLRARTVYFLPLPPPEPVAPRVRPPVPVADQMQRRISPMIRTWFGFERAPDGNTRVVFTWQPGARVRGSAANPILPSLVTLRVLNPDGSVRVEQLLGPVGSADGLATQATFDTVPGRTVIQASVQNEERQVLDTDLRDLTVPAFERDRLAFGTPQVLRATTDAELRRVAADATATPIVTREFVPTERLLVRLPVYGAAGASLTGQLFSSSGVMLRTLEVSAVAGTAFWQTTVSLADLSGGNYYVELAADRDEQARRERIAFGVIH